MKRILGYLVLLAVVVLVAGTPTYFYLNRPDPSEGAAPEIVGAPVTATVLARGEYLAKAADCVACHTEKHGGTPFAGGVPFVLPFGTIYAPNISPDPETGIGKWTDDQFVRAMHDGVRDDGKNLYPAFPYTSYTQLSRNDALAIKAYLFSQPPIKRVNKENELGFPFNQRWAMGFWNAVFFKNQRFVADPSKSKQWNSGAYMAIALEHCAECHTPRNIGFAVEHSNELAGEVIQGWRAPNITSDKLHGIGDWTNDQVAEYLINGHADGRGSAAGPMGEAVENSLQYLNRADIDALVVYLKDVPARKGKDPVTIDAKAAPAIAAGSRAPAKNTSNEHEMGMRLFSSACSSCHQWNGAGQQVNQASLLGSRSVNDPDGANVTMMILEGVDIHVHDTAVYMPGFAKVYSDTEVAALANFVLEQYGNKQGKVTPADVTKLRKNVE